MNVTVKLPDELCRAARHRAIDQSKSLSAWLADLIKHEINTTSKTERQSLVEILSAPETANLEFEIPDRKEMKERKVEFP